MLENINSTLTYSIFLIIHYQSTLLHFFNLYSNIFENSNGIIYNKKLII